MRLVDRIWYGSDAASAAARAVLTPVSAAFGAVVAARRRLYDNGVFATREAVLPCVSIGNLTVGGTGKTPVAAWLAARLQSRAKVAIVLRGYGGDESDVHRLLNPAIPVIALVDRVIAVHMAKAAKAQVVVLDDAFQHRRISRVADIVLISVEQLTRPVRLLPAGPWREPLGSARRADLIVVTAKSASAADVHGAMARVAAAAPGVPVALVRLSPGRLERLGSTDHRPTEHLAGKEVLAIAAIGEPGAFERQLQALGARVTLQSYRDHHAFSASDVRQLADSRRDAMAVCTLKDAVKLAPLWPASRELWYLSQQLVVEQGAEVIDHLCERVLQRVSPASVR